MSAVSRNRGGADGPAADATPRVAHGGYAEGGIDQPLTSRRARPRGRSKVARGGPLRWEIRGSSSQEAMDLETTLPGSKHESSPGII